MMRHCERIELGVELADVCVDETRAALKSINRKHQKYSLALKKQRDYDYAPSVLHIVDTASARAFKQQLPQALLRLEDPEIILLSVTPESAGEDVIFPPHVDKIRICCLNVYVKTNGERTVYYDYAAGAMNEVESFVAQVGECWVLDTTVPHAVELKPPHMRLMVSASFVTTPFEVVRDIMRSYANV